jgi:hypothetical protein
MEEEDTGEPSPRLLVHNIGRILVRHHVDPAHSNSHKIYRIHRHRRYTIRGVRIAFTLFHNDSPL